MGKWQDDETNFTVKVRYHTCGSYLVTLPKPIIQLLKITDSATFVIKGRTVELLAAPNTQPPKPTFSQLIEEARTETA